MNQLQEHNEYSLERNRLEETIRYMSEYLDRIRARQVVYRDEVKEAFVNLDYLDSSQSYITILVNARQLDNSRESLGQVERAIDKPYFARIDFQAEGEPCPKNYYIGKLSLFDENYDPLIIDWRAPLASIYYEGRLGKTAYQAAEGQITGKLKLKRNYTIEDGRLYDFYDMDITTNDEVLQASLRDNADQRLKDIVASIQTEQNRIIRAGLERPLIVQGVAGSGKTTIALHRIAYLIYTYERTFTPDQFMIITPNSLFLNYISDVLPELGVEQVEQTTFTAFSLDLLKVKNKLLGPEEKLQALMQSDDAGKSKEAEWIKWAAAFKGSLEFKAILDRYINQLEIEMLPKEDVILEGYQVVSLAEIKRWFLAELNYLPLQQRQKQVKKKIALKLKEKKKEIIEKINEQYEPDLARARKISMEEEEVNHILVDLLEERDQKLAVIEKNARNLTANYMKKFKKDNVLKAYQKLITNANLLNEYSGGKLKQEGVEHLCREAKSYLKANYLEPEDLAPLLYLKLKLEGFERKFNLSYGVIDEAQDFSLFQFYVLKEVLNTERFTVLGDLSQAIYGFKSINSWDEVNEKIFKDDANYLTLEQSYRTTVEIMDCANRVLQKVLGENLTLASPVVRHGKKPETQAYSSAYDLAMALKDKIADLEEEGCASIAIIGKTMAECKRINELLIKSGRNELPILTGNEETYTAGTLIVPSYAAKGLEFDAVLLATIDEKYHYNELDAKLLYVAMTRSLHQLYHFCLGDKGLLWS